MSKVIIEMFHGYVWIWCFISFYCTFVLAQNETDLSSIDATIWCKFQPNSYECFRQGLGFSRFYYDVHMRDCRAFHYGDCPYSHFNNYHSMADCNHDCRDEGMHEVKVNVTANVFCRYQPDFGSCHSYHPMWYFDISERSCRGFSYSGCGGNLNRFTNSKICSAICSQAIEYA